MVEYTHEFAPTVNWPQCVPVAVAAAQAVAGIERVDADMPPMMISEDFGRFLQAIPGAFVFIGNGDGDSPGACRCTTPATTSTTRSSRWARVSSPKSPAPASPNPSPLPPDMFFLNTHADRRPYDADLQQVLSLSAGRVARERLATWPILSPHPTPAWSLPGLAAALGVAGLTLKDESRRSMLGSFKALGAPIALIGWCCGAGLTAAWTPPSSLPAGTPRRSRASS